MSEGKRMKIYNQILKAYGAKYCRSMLQSRERGALGEMEQLVELRACNQGPNCIFVDDLHQALMRVLSKNARTPSKHVQQEAAIVMLQGVIGPIADKLQAKLSEKDLRKLRLEAIVEEARKVKEC